MPGKHGREKGSWMPPPDPSVKQSYMPGVSSKLQPWEAMMQYDEKIRLEKAASAVASTGSDFYRQPRSFDIDTMKKCLSAPSLESPSDRKRRHRTAAVDARSQFLIKQQTKFPLVLM
eukprot:gnl/TRDRNA2_/TRDRNA2_30654_c0_seq1.p1 gnl/TRDRNA2_/TRDRNA2_30654_c0~~gnl/TRDRNA2_/TRDRNA2_30654_c0_seq1.p1  ORF type:complete len:117 (-),score=23.58 gnl/TRDRNA2_/TRDRNA2_30654_c0_seq1:97-447(-)